ncbi:MAG: hypothetical protein ACLT98_06980 [Eggerthellaceae bacterium]
MADTSSSIELGFIGFGTMAQAMAQGLVDSDALSGEHIHVRGTLRQTEGHGRETRRERLPRSGRGGEPATSSSWR